VSFFFPFLMRFFLVFSHRKGEEAMSIRDQLQETLSPDLLKDKDTEITEIDRLANLLAEAGDDEITKSYIAAQSAFGIGDIAVEIGEHRIKIWFRVFPEGRNNFFYWLRLSRPLGGGGALKFDRVQCTWRD
jgi:hypothetical protein